MLKDSRDILIQTNKGTFLYVSLGNYKKNKLYLK